jgi:cell division protein FtsZ
VARGLGSAAAAEPIAEVPAQPAPQVPSASYVPAPVAFVSGGEDEDDYPPLGKGGYSLDDSADASHGGQGSGRLESPRTVPDKIFDTSAPRRRPVVFEEDDDLDVPDFLK